MNLKEMVSQLAVELGKAPTYRDTIRRDVS